MAQAPDNSVHPENAARWRAWLEENHGRTEGIWFVNYKKATGKPRLEYDEAVEEALCFGWVDSKSNALDEERSMLWFAPRRPGSGWSGSNKERVERLIAGGRMTPAGLAKIEAAKQDGSWTALDAIEALEIPADLAQALAGYDSAAANFDTFPPSAKKNILTWIATAKKPETRARRVEETARLAEDNVRANEWRPK